MVNKIEDLPIVLNVHDLQNTLRISKGRAYEITRRRDFPSFKIGKKILVTRDNFVQWLNSQSST